MGMVNAKPLRLPMSSVFELSSDQGAKLDNPDTHRRLVGKLIYLTISRLDIVFPLQWLSQVMHAPTEEHLIAAKHVFRYLKATPRQEILLCS